MHKASVKRVTASNKAQKASTKKVASAKHTKKITTKAKKSASIVGASFTAQATPLSISSTPYDLSGISPLSSSTPVFVSVAPISTKALASFANPSSTSSAFSTSISPMNFQQKQLKSTRAISTRNVATRHNSMQSIVESSMISCKQTTLATQKSKMNPKSMQKRKFASGASDYPDHELLTMPALSPTMEQGSISSWEKKVGDKVSTGDSLCQVVTDKATVSFDSTEDGYIAKILVEAGDDVIQVGKPVAILVEDEDMVAKFANYKGAGSSSAPAPKPVEAAPAAPAAAPTPAPKAEKDTPETPKVAAPKKSTGDRVSASPFARITAKQLGVELSDVSTQTGMFGSISADDVKNHQPVAKKVASSVADAAAPVKAAAAASKTPVAQTDDDGMYVDEPLSNMRKVIAQRLTQSKQSIPHYYITVEVEMDQINALRGEFNKKLAASAGKDETPVKLSVNDFIIKASAAALKKVPQVNSSWRDTAIRRYSYADISVAVSTDAGLITPIVTDADLKGLATISTEMKSLAGKARKGALQPHEYQGGTFTISNLGMFGVDHFSAIINPPQAAILAIGGTSEKVISNKKFDASVVGSQQFKSVSVMKVTASFDHRVVDGAVGAQFLASFKDFCEDPKKLLL